MKIRTLVDVDTVLADFLGRCLTFINEKSGKNHTLDDMKTWDIFESLGLDREFEESIHERMNQPGICLGLDVLPGSREGLKLIEKESSVYIVTSPMRGATWQSERNEWLYRHFGIKSRQVIHTSAKYAVAGDFLIDDRYSNVERWLASHPHGVGVLWKCEASKHVTEDMMKPRMIYTNDWECVAHLIRERKSRDVIYRTWEP